MEGHDSRTWKASFASSDASGSGVEELRGGSPDLVSSPEVSTWSRTLKGFSVVRSSGNAFCSSVAVLTALKVCREYKFGMAISFLRA